MHGLATAKVESPDEGWDATIMGTGGRGLAVLPGPGTAVAVQATLADGTRVRVIGGPNLDREGRIWYLITGYGAPGAVGWSVGEFLARGEAEHVSATRSAPGTLAPAGRSFQAVLTAYAHGTTTRSGTRVRWGVVAVDPDVIPLGSKLMIEGYDMVFVAEDTGGGVRGNHVDVYFPDLGSAVRFGVQHRTVTVLP